MSLSAYAVLLALNVALYSGSLEMRLSHGPGTLRSGEKKKAYATCARCQYATSSANRAVEGLDITTYTM